MSGRTLVLLLVVLSAAVACDQETPPLPRIPGGASVGAGVRQVELQPGLPLPDVVAVNPVGSSEEVIAEGKRLYGWYNCAGCHFNGGGGIGPPLMDEDWIYGSEPENIYNTIMEGRPAGMPSFRGHLPQEDAWRIVAYVTSLDARTPPAPPTTGGGGGMAGQNEGGTAGDAEGGSS